MPLKSMPAFISRVEAIHSRGAQTRTKVERKKLSSQPKGGNKLLARMDWLVTTLSQMIEDYNYPKKTNQLLHKVSSLHSLITDSMKLDARLKSVDELIGLLGEAAKEMQRLYRSGELAPEVDRKLLHKWLSEVEEVSKEREELSKVMQELQGLREKINKLGLGGL